MRTRLARAVTRLIRATRVTLVAQERHLKGATKNTPAAAARAARYARALGELQQAATEAGQALHADLRDGRLPSGVTMRKVVR